MQQRRGVPSLKHKTGTTVLVLTSHLPGASSKSIGLLADQASFPSTDTVITTKKKLVLFAERNRQRVPLAVDLLHDVDEGRRVVRAGRDRAPFSCWRRSPTALA